MLNTIFNTLNTKYLWVEKIKKDTSINFGFIEKPRPLNEIAYKNIKAAIMAGKIVAGEVYSELQLARNLGISRTPVREALLRLSAENLIVFHSRKGVSINHFSKEDIENLFELRQAIEEIAVTKIVGRLSEDHIQ